MLHQHQHPTTVPHLTTEPRIEQLKGQSLTKSECAERARELLPLYARAFMHSDSEVAAHAGEFLMDLEQHLAASQRITILSHGTERALICGCRCESPEGPIYHLEGVLVDPALQGKGFGSLLLRAELLATGAEFLAFHTQSRVMLGLGMKFAAIDADLAAQMAPYIRHRHLSGTIDEQRYGGKPLYGDLKQLTTIGIPGLNLTQGDALFAVGRVRRDVVRRIS